MAAREVRDRCCSSPTLDHSPAYAGKGNGQLWNTAGEAEARALEASCTEPAWPGRKEGAGVMRVGGPGCEPNLDPGPVCVPRALAPPEEEPHLTPEI